MSHRNHGLKAISLCFLAALGVMAYMATAAQAAVLWDESGAQIAVTLGVTATPVGEFLFLVPSKELTIHCKQVEVEAGTGQLLVNGTGHATLKFFECLTLQGEIGAGNLADQAACDPGTTTAKVKALQILHPATNGKVYILFEPLTGTEFAKIKFPVGCALPNNIAITGSLVAQCLEPAGTVEDCQNPRVIHNISEAPETLFEGDPTLDVLKYGTSRALLDGTAALRLLAPNQNNTWNAWL